MIAVESLHSEVEERLGVIQIGHGWAIALHESCPASLCEVRIIQIHAHVLQELAQSEVAADGVVRAALAAYLDEELLLDHVEVAEGVGLAVAHRQLEDLVDVPVAHEGEVNGAHERLDVGVNHFGLKA